MPEFILYSRPECSLCQDLEQDLRVLQAELGFALTVVDIDGDPALVAQWDRRVPVLVHAGELVCEYFLDPAPVRAICVSSERV